MRLRRLPLKILIGLLVLTIFQVLTFKFLDPPCTFHMAWAWIQHKITQQEYDHPDYVWQPSTQISHHLKKAVLAGEDQRFLDHHGFDLKELSQALEDLLKAGRFRGASTITMQVARTVFLWPDRTWLRKVAEAHYTVLIELLWSKERILEVYLNTVDWGTGIMGAEAAARRYFQINAGRINPAQAALMAAILPNPHAWSATDPSGHVRQRQMKIRMDMSKMPDI